MNFETAYNLIVSGEFRFAHYNQAKKVLKDYLAKNNKQYLLVVADSEIKELICISDKISIDIPKSINNEPVTSIGVSSFESQKKITHISIPSSITNIKEFAFCDCQELTNVYIVDGLECIGSSAFSFCDKLKSITIPKTVTYIGYDAFFECRSLKDVYYAGTKEEWNQINIKTGNFLLKNATIHFGVNVN